MRYLAKGMGAIKAAAYMNKPMKAGENWCFSQDIPWDSMMLPEKAEVNRLVKWTDEEPLDIRKTLKAAGVEV